MAFENIYAELCDSYRAIDDFRMKLLGFLPLASGGIFAFFIHPDFLFDEKKIAVVKPLLPAIGIFGFLVTLGLFAFEIFGIRKCTSLILVGASLEGQQGSKHGQFTDRPEGVLGFIAEPLAAGIIYPSVMAAWAYFALHFSDRACIELWAFAVFGTFFLLSLVFIGWLKAIEIPHLKAKLNQVDDTSKS